MANIEVEKKFALNEASISRIVNSSEFLGERKFRDTYYDTADFRLTRRDMWLRVRAGKFELKLPMDINSERHVDQYTELEDDLDIRRILHIQEKGTLCDDLDKQGYVPFCSIETTRRTYKNSSFTIVLDSMDFGYTIGEVELILDDSSRIPTATESILAFARSMKFGTDPVRGKVIEYIRRKNPPHYQTLVSSGTVRE